MKEYNIFEFLKLVKSEPEKWVNYCEIIITKTGRIILARPSHQECAIGYFCNKMDWSRDRFYILMQNKCDISPLHFVIDKYKLISVWYGSILKSEEPLTPRQRKTIEILQKHNLISKTLYVNTTREYKIFCERYPEDVI